jgi:hypothetical protein
VLAVLLMPTVIIQYSPLLPLLLVGLVVVRQIETAQAVVQVAVVVLRLAPELVVLERLIKVTLELMVIPTRPFRAAVAVVLAKLETQMAQGLVAMVFPAR